MIKQAHICLAAEGTVLFERVLVLVTHMQLRALGDV